MGRLFRAIPNYTVKTFAGGGLPNGVPGASVSLSGPEGLAVDAAGNVFFASALEAVFRLDAATGMLTVVAGNGGNGFSGDNGPATSAEVSFGGGGDLYSANVAVDGPGNLYIADQGNGRVRKVSNGVISTIAQLYSPSGIAVDTAGNVYVASGNRIMKVANGVITTVAGNSNAGFGGDGGQPPMPF